MHVHPGDLGAAVPELGCRLLKVMANVGLLGACVGSLHAYPRGLGAAIPELCCRLLKFMANVGVVRG